MYKKKFLILAVLLFAMTGTLPLEAVKFKQAKGGHNEVSSVTKKQQKDIKKFRKAAAEGDFKAMYSLGVIYEQGLLDSDGKHYQKPDYKEAGIWYRKAADMGFAPAQNALGSMYADARGVCDDFRYDEAVKWYRKAAEQDYAEAQYNLACMYYRGEGVEKNLKLAEKWFRKAANQGYEPAQDILKKWNSREK